MSAKKSAADSVAATESSITDADVDPQRRRLLVSGASVIGGVGAAALAVPMLSSMSPSAISKLAPGQMLTVEWRGKPVWVVNRTEAMLESMQAGTSRLSDPDSEVEQQPSYATNKDRSIKSEIFVVVGICTHLGCSPTYRPEVAPADLGSDWDGGFFCPCHGSKFDLAGRVYSGVPAPTNLEVPPYRYATDSLIVVGEDSGEALA